MSPEDDICFYDPSFYPTEETALEYFRNSPFYDKQCNNEILRMQMQYNANMKININERLKEMVGVEYSFRENISNIFIIQKSYRKDNEKTILLDLYYIMNGIVYKAPTDKSIFTSRFINSVASLNKALDIYNDRITLFDEINVKKDDEEFNEILKILADYKLR
ncbi:hypothetical protein H312_02249 [Anncaliia algerae PRA339]|uniref:Mediator of RNA polymerase II transcription subunit 6 n=1 Tax=Anncaliia algerae PRA339 TaxID=1288291 RepID=A0A059EZQ1_9MICR|nr:hypothetical protein H312_02249 [Anncaliia algerae PRA339]